MNVHSPRLWKCKATILFTRGVWMRLGLPYITHLCTTPYSRSPMTWFWRICEFAKIKWPVCKCECDCLFLSSVRACVKLAAHPGCSPYLAERQHELIEIKHVYNLQSGQFKCQHKAIAIYIVSISQLAYVPAIHVMKTNKLYHVHGISKMVNRRLNLFNWTNYDVSYLLVVYWWRFTILPWNQDKL